MDLGSVSSCGEGSLAGKERKAGRLTDHVGATGLRSFGESPYMLSTARGAWSSMPMGMARLGVVVWVLAPLFLASCGESQQQTRAVPPPPSVTVSKPVAR